MPGQYYRQRRWDSRFKSAYVPTWLVLCFISFSFIYNTDAMPPDFMPRISWAYFPESTMPPKFFRGRIFVYLLCPQILGACFLKLAMPLKFLGAISRVFAMPPNFGGIVS